MYYYNSVRNKNKIKGNDKMTIQERKDLTSEVSKEILRAVRAMEQLGYKDDYMASVIEEIIEIKVHESLKNIK
jgi:Holliday junction resolvasome RuvABC DNA-binding subunit